MKTHITLTCLLAFVLTTASAEVLLSEPFDYPQGTDLNNQSGGTGFSSPWETMNAKVTHGGVLLEPGLLHGGLDPAIAGRSLMAPLTSGTYYFGFSAQNMNGGDTRAGISLGFQPWNNGGVQEYVTIFQGAESSTWSLALFEGTETTETLQDIAQTTFSTTMLTHFVLKISLGESDNSAIISLFINPTASTEPVMANASVSGTLSKIEDLAFVSNAPRSGGTLKTNLMLGAPIAATTFAEAATFAVPELSTFAFLIGWPAFLIGIARTIRRKFQTKAS